MASTLANHPSYVASQKYRFGSESVMIRTQFALDPYWYTILEQTNESAHAFQRRRRVTSAQTGTVGMLN